MPQFRGENRETSRETTSFCLAFGATLSLFARENPTLSAPRFSPRGKRAKPINPRINVRFARVTFTFLFIVGAGRRDSAISNHSIRNYPAFAGCDGTRADRRP